MLKLDWNLLWTVIDLIVFFLLIRLVLFKPIKKTIAKRKELIDNQFKSAEEANTAAEQKMADYEQKIADINAEGDRIIAEARDSAKKEYNKIIDRAEKNAENIKEQTRRQIAFEQENALRASREEIVSLAMQTAEKVVGRAVSAETDSDIFDEFLSEDSVE